MPPAFAPADAAWSARPTDPHDLFLAQVVQAAGPGPDPDAPVPAPAPGGARIVGLFGVPFDGAVIGRKGAREGPDAIRAQMARLKPWTLRGGEPPLRVRDWGNVLLPPDCPTQRAHEATQAAAREVLAAGHVPVALGGDHSLTFPLVMAHRGTPGERGPRRRVGVINLDAHLDVRDVVGGVLNSGQSFGRLLESGFVPGENLVEVGLRDFANAAHYAEKARKAGATLIGADEWLDQGLAAIDRAIDVASRGTDGVYLSVDVDVLDQAHAPGVSAPTPGGVDTATLYAAIRRIAERAPLIGADFMEAAPPLDRDNLTTRAAAYGVGHLLADLAMREAR